jgi:outer membrane protein assembly factor BamE
MAMKTLYRPLGTTLIAVGLLAGCQSPGWLKSVTESPPNWLTPYRTDIGQGNYISQPMAERLQKGMSRDQVRAVLGTPLLVDPFRANRWDYVFEIRRGDGSRERRRFWVLFENDVLASWDGDPLPAEGGADILPARPAR